MSERPVNTLTRLRLVRTLVLLVLLLLGAIVVGLTFGSSRIDLRRALDGWLSGALDEPDTAVLVYARLPRVAAAAVVGAALASTGGVFQGLLKNPLADPYILGISGGASVGVILAISVGAGGTLLGFSALPLAAFVGALLSVGLLYLVAAALPGGLGSVQSTNTLLLTGVVFNAFAMAIVLLLRALMAPLDAQRSLLWLMGSLSATRLTWSELALVTSIVLIGLVVILRYARALNVMALGDDTARSLGTDPVPTRLVLFIASSLVVGAAVATAGMVGFVGLVVPHGLRLWLGVDHRLLLPASVLGGATFLVLADTCSRALFPLTNASLPVGSVTAFVGVPLFFLFLIRSLRVRHQ